MTGSAPDNEAGLDDAFLGMVVGEGTLNKANEDIGRLFTDLCATLLYCREHGVADGGAEAVGETTDAYLVGDGIAQPFHYRKDANGCLVVDGKEGVRPIRA